MPPNWTGLTTACWLWKGTCNSRGYGIMSVRKPAYDADGRRIGTKVGKVLVHRVTLKEFLGVPIERIEVAGHLCSTKRCCNPDHEDPGSALDNRQFYYTVERPMRLALEAGAAA